VSHQEALLGRKACSWGHAWHFINAQSLPQLILEAYRHRNLSRVRSYSVWVVYGRCVPEHLRRRDKGSGRRGYKALSTENGGNAPAFVFTVEGTSSAFGRDVNVSAAKAAPCVIIDAQSVGAGLLLRSIGQLSVSGAATSADAAIVLSRGNHWRPSVARS